MRDKLACILPASFLAPLVPFCYDFIERHFLQAVKYIEYDTSFGEEEKKQAKALKVACNLNNAACKLKLKDYKEAEKLCTKVCFL